MGLWGTRISKRPIWTNLPLAAWSLGAVMFLLRYAWANFPLANLYNSADLPTGPFRTY